MVGSPAETRVRLHPARPAERRPHLTTRPAGSPMPSVETPAPRPRPRPAYAGVEPLPERAPAAAPAPAPVAEPALEPAAAATPSVRTHPNAGIAMLMIVGGGFLTQLLTTVT